MEAHATQSVVEGLTAELIDGRGVALMLRPYEALAAEHCVAAQ
jgi:intracellular multiplication protein IcmB